MLLDRDLIHISILMNLWFKGATSYYNHLLLTPNWVATLLTSTSVSVLHPENPLTVSALPTSFIVILYSSLRSARHYNLTPRHTDSYSLQTFSAPHIVELSPYIYNLVRFQYKRTTNYFNRLSLLSLLVVHLTFVEILLLLSCARSYFTSHRYHSFPILCKNSSVCFWALLSSHLCDKFLQSRVI